MSDWYVLDENHQPVKVPLLEGAKALDTADRQVRETNVGSYRISTVFLGLDHSFGEGPPVLFETMVFGPGEEDCERYSTWEEAERGHDEMVKKWSNP